ncbi:hypothetical protein [Sphingomonas sp.]|uniref:hypothetical protein n=1 Tax=Sphingomonas sp. TaxID=28214 RepID=UPI00286D264A|nr:hypothetical protein [Sphingomonas sp.]
MTKKVCLLCSLWLLAACRDDRPPAPTAAQSDQLNDAEDMLNDAAQDKGPGDRSPGPSN